MFTWRFFQGIRDEWRWYQMDETGSVVATADRGFEELPACMANAAVAGFAGQHYQVIARSPLGAVAPNTDTPRKVIPGVIPPDSPQYSEGEPL